jgi:hypothetical protein
VPIFSSFNRIVVHGALSSSVAFKAIRRISRNDAFSYGHLENLPKIPTQMVN